MAKHKKKVQAKLARRQGAYQATMPQSGQQCHMPGSQNLKKR
jgi:hypothetical protein